MKQFSLDEYLADTTKRVVTRDGKDVRIICTDRKSPNIKHSRYPIIALINIGKFEEAFSYLQNGSFNTNGPHYLDLFFAQTKHSRWVYLYRQFEDSIVYASEAFTSHEAAEEDMRKHNGFGLTEITWEE